MRILEVLNLLLSLSKVRFFIILKNFLSFFQLYFAVIYQVFLFLFIFHLCKIILSGIVCADIISRGLFSLVFY